MTLQKKAPANAGPGGRYAHLSRLIDELCTVRVAGKWTVGIVRGLWTDNDGDPQCAVLTADSRLKRVSLSNVRFPDAADRIAVAKEAAEANARHRAEAKEAARAGEARFTRTGRRQLRDDDHGPSSLE